MRYDLSNELHRKQFLTRANKLCEKGAIIELTEKTNRTINQNAYLHLILGLFALEVGERTQYVKDYYYKQLCNKDLFVVEKNDPYVGKIIYLKSTTTLNKEEMTESIERFRQWAGEQGIYLPSPHEEELLKLIQIDINRNRHNL